MNNSYNPVAYVVGLLILFFSIICTMEVKAQSIDYDVTRRYNDAYLEWRDVAEKELISIKKRYDLENSPEIDRSYIYRAQRAATVKLGSNYGIFENFDTYVYPSAFGKRNPIMYVKHFYNLIDVWTDGILEYDDYKSVQIRYTSTDGNVLAVATGMNDNCSIIITINPAKWYEMDSSQRAFVMYHELLHDMFNLEHGEGNLNIMHPYAENKILWYWDVAIDMYWAIDYVVKTKKEFKCKTQ